MKIIVLKISQKQFNTFKFYTWRGEVEWEGEVIRFFFYVFVMN